MTDQHFFGSIKDLDFNNIIYINTLEYLIYKGIVYETFLDYIRLNDEFDIYYAIERPRRYKHANSSLKDYMSNSNFDDSLY